MNVQRLVTLALVLVASTTAVYAGSCADEIGRMQARINAKLEAVARTVPPASAARQCRSRPPGRYASPAHAEIGGGR